MRRSKLFIKTSKTAPHDEEAVNAKLLIQAGYVHKTMAGVYSFLPLGKLVIDKIAQIVREEMNAVGALEVQMSILQAKEIWQKTGRWDDKVVDNWFKTKLANGTELGLGLTHEETIINSLMDFINSYKDLPISLYQIQMKFRNELRSKSGLMRGREFLMKDLYSFSRNQQEHDNLYQIIADSYLKIYQRLGIGELTYRTYGDGGIFSKVYGDEFQTLSDRGEDLIYVDLEKKIAINQEIYSAAVIKELKLDKEALVQKKAVEVGNIFSLGSKYTDALGLYYNDKLGQRQSIIMGCYGLGISRLMGLIAELFSDDKGLIWPNNIAPALIYLITIGNSLEVTNQAEELYQTLTNNDVAVIYDDRNDIRPGEKFAEADLMGLPYRLVISDKTIKNNYYEFKARQEEDSEKISKNILFKRLGLK